MIDDWGNANAMRWLVASAAVLWAYIAYWFWKAQRVRHIDALLGVAHESEPSRRRLRLFGPLALVFGALYAGAFHLTLGALAAARLGGAPLSIEVQLVVAGIAMLMEAALGAGLLALVARWMLGRGVAETGAAMARMVRERSARKQILRFALFFLALVLVTVAVMRPQGPGEQREVKRRGIDIVFAVDLSRSMLAEDVKPNRLEAAKDEIERTLKRLKGDRVGLVVFTAVSFTQSPLTSDYGAIRVYLDKIHPEQMPAGGTAVGRAILDGVELLTGESFLERGAWSRDTPESEPATTTSDHARIIVLFTDGEDHESDPGRAAAEARNHDIRIFTVGFGSPEGSFIPTYDEEGMPSGFVTRGGQPVLSRLDEATLHELAQSTGGSYFHFEGKGTVASRLVDEIDSLEKAELETLLKESREDYFWIFLLPAMFLLFGSHLLGDRRGFHVPFTDGLGGGDGPRGGGRAGARRRRAMRRTTSGAGLLLTLLLTLGGCSDDGTGWLERKNPQVLDGIARLQDGDPDGAVEHFERARDALPDEPMLDYDLGLAHLRAGRAEVALEHFVRAKNVAPERDGGDALFQVHFGMGNAYYRLGERAEQADAAAPAAPPADPGAPPPAALVGPSAAARVHYRAALRFYQLALEHDPDHEGVRYNLELTLYKLFPPCRRFEDAFEENDTAATATAAMEPDQLAALREARLTVCGGDDDLYRLAAGAGFKVSVEATFSRLEQRDELMDDSARLDYAQLELALVDETGKTIFASDAGQPPPAHAPPTPPARVTRVIDTFELPAEAGEGPVFLRVRAQDSAEAHYRLAIKLVPPCGQFEDSFEDNDSREEAATLEPGQHPEIRVCPRDEDWYTFEVQPGDSVFFDLAAMPHEESKLPPQLEVELYAEGQSRPVRTGRTGTGGQKGVPPALNLEVYEWPRAETFFLRVRGIDDQQQEGPYAMEFHHFPPCIVGDDPFEDNDSAEASAALPPEERLFRYLRHCGGDDDWYIATAAAPQAPPGAGLAPGAPAPGADPGGSGQPIGFRATIEYEPRRGDLSLTAYDPVTAEVLAVGEVAQSSTPGKQVKSLSLPGALDGEQIQLQVSGDQNFYHLKLDTPDSQQDQSDQNEPQDEPQDQPQDEPQDQPQDEPQDQDDGQGDDPKDPQDGDDSQQQQQPEDGDQDDAQQQPQDGDQDDAQQQPSGPGDDEERDAGRPLSPDELKDRRINDLLDRLESQDPNLPLDRAREQMPDRHIENDW